MPPKKDAEEELKDAAARGEIERPQRTYCEACDLHCGSRWGLLQHIQLNHPA